MTTMLTVQAKSAVLGWECAVDTGGSRHTVHVRPEDMQRWGRPDETPEALVTRSFEFLLRREPASAILGSFGLADIERYFPEFDQEIRR